MLPSFYIKNYRLFKELKIPSLKRINLIIGQNNVGKSSLLEAIDIYNDTNSTLVLLIEKLITRNEIISDDINSNDLTKIMSSIWHYDTNAFNQVDCIKIGQTEEYLSFYLDKITDNGTIKYQLKTTFNHQSETLRILSLEKTYTSIEVSNTRAISALQHAGDNTMSSRDWSKIALTDKEQYVIQALQLIHPSIENFAFIDEFGHQKKAIVKLKGKSTPVSLNSMGEGIKRILEIILNLIHAENGTLIIDEFENGLHWSVQLELWRIIFYLSDKLNIQIFASTHSRDTLWALEKAAIKGHFEKQVQVVKLKKSPKNGHIRALSLGVEDIKLALEQDLEIR